MVLEAREVDRDLGGVLDHIDEARDERMDVGVPDLEDPVDGERVEAAELLVREGEQKAAHPLEVRDRRLDVVAPARIRVEFDLEGEEGDRDRERVGLPQLAGEERKERAAGAAAEPREQEDDLERTEPAEQFVLSLDGPPQHRLAVATATPPPQLAVAEEDPL